MEDIKQVISREYMKASRMIQFLFVASFVILALPLYYEASIGFPHVMAMARLSLASIYVMMVWLSGFCFGSAAFYRKILKRWEEMF